MGHFSYATVEGSPGMVLETVQAWSSANHILHKREPVGLYRILKVCHSQFGCKYVFEDDSLSGGWIAGYRGAMNALVVAIGLVATEALITCAVGAIFTPAGCVAAAIGATPAYAITAAGGVIAILGLFIMAEMDLHKQWNQVVDIRPIAPWRRSVQGLDSRFCARL